MKSKVNHNIFKEFCRYYYKDHPLEEIKWKGKDAVSRFFLKKSLQDIAINYLPHHKESYNRIVFPGPIIHNIAVKMGIYVTELLRNIK